MRLTYSSALKQVAVVVELAGESAGPIATVVLDEIGFSSCNILQKPLNFRVFVAARQVLCFSIYSRNSSFLCLSSLHSGRAV